MIQKIRNNDIAFLDTKYAIDKFHNPYLSKFSLKLTPSTINQQQKSKLHFISPFDSTNYLYLSQSLPIYKSQKFRASLVWKQTMRKKMARGFIGLSSQYRAQNMWSIKTRAMFGSIILYNLQAIKKIDQQTEVILYHHGTYDNSNISPIFGVGGKKKQFSATFHRRLGLDYNSVLQYSKPLPKGLYLCAKTQMSLGQNLDKNSFSQTNYLTFDYFYQKSIRARAGITHVMEQKQIKPIVEVQKQTQSWGKFLLSIEYRNNASIVSVGYKNPTLNLILPVIFVQSPIPTLIGAFLYIAGYINRKKQTHVVQLKKKQQDLRRDQLKLISDKGNANYQKERASGLRGLLIEEAFVGPTEFLDKIQRQNNRGAALYRDNELKENVFDVTICLRFYVIKGQLRLKKGDKNHLLGFYCNNSDDQVLIKYKKGDEIKQLRVKMTDQILIK